MATENGNSEHVTRTLSPGEQAMLRDAIAARGARAIANAIGISPDALTGAASGGHARAGTNAACRVWLNRAPSRGDA